MRSRRPSILIVEDSQNWRELLTMILEDEYNTCTASTYTQALQVLREHKPPFDVAIVDIRLDDTDSHNEDGIHLLRDIQKLEIKTRVIVLTGYPDLRTSKIALRDMGAFDYLEKYPSEGGGLDIENLRQVVRQAAGELRALLIEDDPRWQDMLASILKEEGYSVDQVVSSAEAQQHLQARHYPVAIVDLKLGNESPDQGIDFLASVGKQQKRTGFVVISGYGSKERVRDAFERGRAKAFIFKDQFDPAQFREKVKWVATTSWSFSI